MNKSIKLLLTLLIIFMIIGCSGNKSVLVGDTVDIEDYNRPSNIVKYQWSFDTKPVMSRLDPRDFIPSNYHPNVTFIPDVPGRYIVRLTMINNEGLVLHKNFAFTADPQPDYLAALEEEKKTSKEVKEVKKEEPKKVAAPAPAEPKIVEVPVVTEKVILKKTTVTKKPNEWIVAPSPGQSPEEVVQEPAYTTESVTEVIEENKKPVVIKPEQPAKVISEQKVVKVTDAKYTLQVSSTTVEAFAVELKDKLLKQGYDAFIQKAEVDGLMRYRIRVGKFASYNDAKAYRQKMLDETEFEPWVDRIK